MAMLIRVSHLALLGALALTPLFPASAYDKSSRLDRAWKRYVNAKTGYCVSYPRRWVRGDAYDGDGLYAESGMRKLSAPLGSLDISATSEENLTPQAKTPAIQPVNFNADAESHMDGLKRFLRVQDTEILDRRPFKLAGADSLLLKTRYFDPREHSSWIEEIVFARKNGVLYRLELQARADQIERFEPIFTRFVNSFQFECKH
jgi:hypothetical protein